MKLFPLPSRTIFSIPPPLSISFIFLHFAFLSSSVNGSTHYNDYLPGLVSSLRREYLQPTTWWNPETNWGSICTCLTVITWMWVHVLHPADINPFQNMGWCISSWTKLWTLTSLITYQRQALSIDCKIDQHTSAPPPISDNDYFRCKEFLSFSLVAVLDNLQGWWPKDLKSRFLIMLLYG